MFEDKGIPGQSISNKSIFLILTGILFLLCPTLTSARTLSVPENSPSIKGAMIQAQAGDIILVSCGTYYEHDISLKPGVALWSGTLQPSCVTIDAQGKGRVFRLDRADTNTALVGFTIRGGFSADKGGGLLCRQSSPRISNCIFEDNSARHGGAFASDSQSSPVITNCQFKNNQAHLGGGAFLVEGPLVLKQSALEKNQALIGAGLMVANGGDLKIMGCNLQANEAGNTGGALHLQESKVEIGNCVFADNWGGLGGAVVSSRSSTLKLHNSTLFRNATDHDGGILALDQQAPSFVNCIIAYSQSEILRSDSAVPAFSGCNLYGNEAGDWTQNLRPLANKNNNISQDPLFCAPEFGNFMLRNSSSCLPGNNPSGNKGLVGALGAGCASAGNIEPSRENSGSGFKAVSAGL